VLLPGWSYASSPQPGAGGGLLGFSRIICSGRLSFMVRTSSGTTSSGDIIQNYSFRVCLAPAFEGADPIGHEFRLFPEGIAAVGDIYAIAAMIFFACIMSSGDIMMQGP
jgi:hypothetical protein